MGITLVASEPESYIMNDSTDSEPAARIQTRRCLTRLARSHIPRQTPQLRKE